MSDFRVRTRRAASKVRARQEQGTLFIYRLIADVTTVFSMLPSEMEATAPRNVGEPAKAGRSPITQNGPGFLFDSEKCWRGDP
jgi:hypothetical protein